MPSGSSTELLPALYLSQHVMRVGGIFRFQNLHYQLGNILDILIFRTTAELGVRVNDCRNTLCRVETSDLHDILA